MKKRRRSKKASSWVSKATTTAWDWGFKPVACKGGKTTNAVIGEKKK